MGSVLVSALVSVLISALISALVSAHLPTFHARTVSRTVGPSCTGLWPCFPTPCPCCLLHWSLANCPHSIPVLFPALVSGRLSTLHSGAASCPGLWPTIHTPCPCCFPAMVDTRKLSLS